MTTIGKPDTMLGWHHTRVAQKCDGSQQRKAPGRPRIAPALEALIVRMAQEHRAWGSDRMVGALANLGLTVSAQTVGNVLKRHGLPPAPERKTTTTWKDFIRVAYLLATDNVSGLLPIRLSESNQPMLHTRNRFSSPRPCLLTCI